MPPVPPAGRRDCRCPRARHQHGTKQAYVIDKCRCQPCRDATAAYERRRTRLKAYGRTGRVDAAPIREHLLALMAAGTGYARTAELSGVPVTTVATLIYGRHDRRQGRPALTCTEVYARAILAVQHDTWRLAPATRVPAIGTQRRAQALVAIGWNQQQIADMIGMARANLGRMMIGTQVRLATAKTVRDLYDRLWDTPPPQDTPMLRSRADRARRHARLHGWPTPLHWDDESIDLPVLPNLVDLIKQPKFDEIAVERAVRGEPVRLTRAELSEARVSLERMGMSAREIAARLGVTPRTVQRARAQQRQDAAA